MPRWRWLNCAYAFIQGYFWAPCPICGRNFGGHEWSEDLYIGNGISKGTCPWCVEETKRRNAEYFASDAWRRELEAIGRYPAPKL